MAILVSLIVVLLCAGAGFYYWSIFHPENAVTIVGPAGVRHRAYFEDRGIRKPGVCVCVSDWPYTLREPFVLDGEGGLFWSADGSVLVNFGDGTEYNSAYDFREHTSFRYRHDLIEALIESRGGLGPRVTNFPDDKGFR